MMWFRLLVLAVLLNCLAACAGQPFSSGECVVPLGRTPDDREAQLRASRELLHDAVALGWLEFDCAAVLVQGAESDSVAVQIEATVMNGGSEPWSGELVRSATLVASCRSGGLGGQIRSVPLWSGLLGEVPGESGFSALSLAGHASDTASGRVAVLPPRDWLYLKVGIEVSRSAAGEEESLYTWGRVLDPRGIVPN